MSPDRSADRNGRRRCLGPLAVSAQAAGTVGFTLTAVINSPQVDAQAGHSTPLGCRRAFIMIDLVSETLVQFQRSPGRVEGIAGSVRTGLGHGPGQLGAWLLVFGYGASLVACLAFLDNHLKHLLAHLGLPLAPALWVAVGGLLWMELARRDIRLATGTMLCTETISLLIVPGLCLLVLQRGGVATDLGAMIPSGDHWQQVQAGLMAAMLSFISVESAATLGSKSLDSQRSVDQVLRTAVLLSGTLFLIWSVGRSEGMGWLSSSQRAFLDPISLLADQLGQPGAGLLIKFGTFLCLVGTCIGYGPWPGQRRPGSRGGPANPAGAGSSTLPDAVVALWGLGLPMVVAAAGSGPP